MTRAFGTPHRRESTGPRANSLNRRIRELLDEGVRDLAIADRLGCTAEYVRAVRREHLCQDLTGADAEHRRRARAASQALLERQLMAGVHWLPCD